MTPLAIFGITNDGLNLAVNLLLLFLVVFWLALVYWTFADARRRITDPMLVGCATAASLFPFAGTIVYMIVRPPEFLEDVRERDLEIAAAEARLASIGQYVCPHCSNEVEKTFLRCPNCHRRLKEPCMTCGQALDPRWSICPYCEAAVGQRGQQPRPRRERRRERPPSGTGQAPPREGAQRPAAARPAPEARPRVEPGTAPVARPARSARPPADGETRAVRPDGATADPATAPSRSRPPAADGVDPAPRRARPPA